MAETYQGVIAQIRNEGFNAGRDEGFNDGERSIILRLLENNTLTEVANILHMKTSEILDIINKED
jgi:hypothetical protein